MTSPRTITLHRERLSRAAAKLSPFDLAILIHLALRATPETACLWMSPSRLAAELAMPEPLVMNAMERVLSAGFGESRPDNRIAYRLIDLADLLQKTPSPPPNLPVDPRPV